MLTLTVGRGNHRREFVLPSGAEARQLSKAEPVEYAKIRGGIVGLMRLQGA